MINPATEQPYSRHKWGVPEKAPTRVRQRGDDPVTFYRVRCVRCGINDPNAPTH